MEPDLCTRGRISTMAFVNYAIGLVFLNFLCACATTLDLELACKDITQHAECSFIGHGVYNTRSKAISIVRSVTFDSLRNSKISLQNSPNVNLVQIASKDFDEYEPCQHLLGNLWPVIVDVESKRTICVSKIYTFIANVPVICNYCSPTYGE